MSNVASLPLFAAQLSIQLHILPFFVGWLPFQGNVSNSLSQVGIPYGSECWKLFVSCGIRKVDWNHWTVVCDRGCVYQCSFCGCNFKWWLMVDTLWKVWQYWDIMFLCLCVAKLCFARIIFVRPVYLGCAARIMGEGNVMVWYGMVPQAGSSYLIVTTKAYIISNIFLFGI